MPNQYSLFTVQQVASLCHVSVSDILYWIKHKKIPVTGTNKQDYRIDRRHLPQIRALLAKPARKPKNTTEFF